MTDSHLGNSVLYTMLEYHMQKKSVYSTVSQPSYLLAELLRGHHPVHLLQEPEYRGRDMLSGPAEEPQCLSPLQPTPVRHQPHCDGGCLRWQAENLPRRNLEEMHEQSPGTEFIGTRFCCAICERDYTTCIRRNPQIKA